MKRLSILALAAILVIAFTVPATAFFESEFGGYWRTRAFKQENFDGTGNGDRDVSRADTRSRLFYTAYFTDTFKFVNKFEMDATWGDNSDDSWGDISTDGVAVEVKNSYADFNTGAINLKLGAQHKILARGLVFDDDFAGAIARYKTDDYLIPFIWIKAYEGGVGQDRNKGDVDYYVLDPRIKLGEGIWLNPFVMYAYSDDASNWFYTSGNEEIKVYFAGVNLDADFDFGSFWVTGIYEGGTADLVTPTAGGDDSLDVQGWLAAVNGSVDVGPVDIHGQFFYASGDDDPDDGDAEDFFVPKGQSFYWSEIMGLGVFDNQPSAGAPGDQISNVWAGNLGIGFTPMEDLTVTADVWHASLAEDDENGNDTLGTEIDLKATYKFLERMNLDLVAAYLIADDATYDGDDDDENPWEIGTRLWFNF